MPIDLNNLIANYTFTDNGTAYNGGFKGCDFDSVFSYLYMTIPGQGATGPYNLNSWTVSGQSYNGSFNNIAELVTKMNQWDNTGSWTQDLTTKTIKGGNPAKVYGSMSITRPSTGDNANLQLNTQLLPLGTGLSLGVGTHKLLLTNKTTGCKDSITVKVLAGAGTNCADIIAVKSKILVTTNCVNGTSYCIVEIPLNETNLYTFTDNGQPITATPSPCGTTSFVFTPGDHQLIVSRNGTCCKDTVQIKVICTTIQTVSIVVRQREEQEIPLHTADLIGRIVNVSTVQKAGERSAGGEYVGFELNKAAKSVKVLGRDLGTEESIFVVCDEMGVCDTTILRVTVIAEGATSVPTAVTDNVKTKVNKAVIVDVKRNDRITGSAGSAERAAGNTSNVKLESLPSHGIATLNADATFTYKPEKGFCGNDEFSYQLCNPTGDCNSATVYVQVVCDNIVVYSGFSPNNDGINDAFTIQGIEEYPNNKLTIFNKAGNEVFRTTGYKNDWNGKSKGSDVIDGTYFYMLEDGEGNTFSGYVQIAR